MEERLKNPDNRIIDVFIVHAKTKRQSVRVQKKMIKMGFSPLYDHIKIYNTWNCYFVAKMCHSNDEFNGNKFMTHGGDLDKVYESKEFSKSRMNYKDFMKI